MSLATALILAAAPVTELPVEAVPAAAEAVKQARMVAAPAALPAFTSTWQ